MAVIFFLYARPAILACKQLDLQKKSPIYHFQNESNNGVTQIKLYGQAGPRMEQFSKIMNESTQASLSFEMIARALGFYETIFSILLIAVGSVMGLIQIDPENKALYGVSLVYLITINEYLQWTTRQMILV